VLIVRIATAGWDVSRWWRNRGRPALT